MGLAIKSFIFEVTKNTPHMFLKKNRAIKREKSKFLLRFIQTYAVIGTWEYDTELNLLTWSDETRKIHEAELGFEPNVESGISFYKEGYSRKLIQTLFSQCLEKHESFDVELQIITAKGREKWVRAIGKPEVNNGICVRVLGLFQDIDDQTKKAKLLALKEEELRTNFEQAIVGMAILDLTGHWIKVNDSLNKMLGYNQGEFLKLTFMDITHVDDLNNDTDAFKRLFSGEIDHYKCEKRYIHKNGDTVWVKLSSSLVKNKFGEPMHFIAQISDITKAKNHAIKIKKLLKTTESQNERLLNFSHIVSHNLRSHYSNLFMLIDILKTDLPETTKNEIFPMVEEAVTNLGETIDNLNEVASINTKKDMPLEPINLLDRFNRVTTGVSGLILNADANLHVAINPDITVKGIPAYMDSVLLNFLTNAIKYKKPNTRPNIEIEALTKDDKVILKIKDHGLGIDLKMHGKKLFGMYKTFHKHKDARGLGLFITKNQIQAMGGKIDVESEVNVGTTFYLEFLKHT